MKHTRSIMSITMATIVLASLCAVCASTSVGAATTSSSRASVQATPDLVGSPIAAGTGPSACALNGSTDMYVFVKGYDGALWYRIWDTSTDNWARGWNSLGGKLTSSPCAVSREAGYINVYVRGTNGAVYQKPLDSTGVWLGWYNLGGQVAPNTGPGACGWAGREDLFAEGTNGALYQKTWDSSSSWSGWTNLGGQLTSSPAVMSPFAFSHIDVFVRGTNGAVYEKIWDQYGWSGWTNLGGNLAPNTGPAACSYGTDFFTGREDLFVEGTNGALYTKTWAYGYGWPTTWTNLGGQLTSSPTAATFTYGGTIDMPVFVRGTNGFVYYKEFYGGSWHNWSTGITGPP